MIWVYALFGGLAIGVMFALKIILGLILWGSANSSEWEAKSRLSAEKRAWLKTLTPADRAAYLLHEKRKVQYVKLRRNFREELNRQVLKEFKRVKPTYDERFKLENQITRRLWAEWDMNSWDDINMSEDCPFGLTPSWPSGIPEEAYLGPKPLWVPPKWRREEGG